MAIAGQRLSTRRLAIGLLIFVSAAAALFLITSSSYLPYFKFRTKPLTYAKTPSLVDSYSLPPGPERKDYHQWNTQTFRELDTCIASEQCKPNQLRVALLGAHWFQEVLSTDFRGGEGIWALSVYENLRELGYTTIFAVDWPETLALYRLMPDLIKVVIRNTAGICHEDPQCVKSPSNPTGIPAWKIFDFEYFPSHGTHYGASLLKGPWILSADTDVAPQDNNPIQYIGYSIQKACSIKPVLPLAGRQNRIWLLMKQLTYVYNSYFAWNREWFAQDSEELGLSFTGAWRVDQHYMWDPETMGEMADIEDREHGIVNLGSLNQTEFVHELGDSKVLVGMGQPYWSPSPYNALCQGVPFLNPVLWWDEQDPTNRSKWFSQHPSLSMYDPPYVYNVFENDHDGFVNAIQAASSTEIDGFIPPHMTDTAIQERLVRLMETDWRIKAAELLEERLKEGGDAYIFEL